MHGMHKDNCYNKRTKKKKTTNKLVCCLSFCPNFVFKIFSMQCDEYIWTLLSIFKWETTDLVLIRLTTLRGVEIDFEFFELCKFFLCGGSIKWQSLYVPLFFCLGCIENGMECFENLHPLSKLISNTCR